MIPASEIEGTAAHAAAHPEDADVEPFRDEPSPRAAEPSFDADSVFAKLKPLRRGAGDEE